MVSNEIRKRNLTNHQKQKYLVEVIETASQQLFALTWA